MPNISDNLIKVHQRIQAVTERAGRNPHAVTLLAVSKTKPVEDIAAAYHAGQRDFGENYAQEALGKIQQLAHLDLIWHFIGPIQSNKSRVIAEHFDWVHSVDRLKIAQRLSEQRPKHLPPLNICLQVNIDHQISKAGCDPGTSIELAKSIAVLPGLALRGLMAIPAPNAGEQPFIALAQLMKEMNSQLRSPIDTLSMGMSADMDSAIAAGATIVRIGSAIFGERAKPAPG